MNANQKISDVEFKAAVERLVEKQMEEAAAAAAALPESLRSAMPDLDALVIACRGRNGLRTGKPKCGGAAAYVWRWARFHAGDDVTFPVCSTFDLADWFRSAGCTDSYCIGPVSKAAHTALEHLAFIVCLKLGRNPFRSTIRWSKALGML